MKKPTIAIALNNEVYDIVKRRAMENGLTIARYVEDRICVEHAAVKHASNVGWLGTVIGHTNGELEIRFTEGRSVEAIELLNSKMECLTVAKLHVQPGDALVFHTSTPTAPRTPILQGPPQDEAGIYSNVYRRWSTSPSWELLFRCAGSISDETVRQRCGVGLYRISVHHNLSLAADSKVLSTREVTVYVEATRLCPWTTGGDANGVGAVSCGQPATYYCGDHAPFLLCERHKSSCCSHIVPEAAP